MSCRETPGGSAAITLARRAVAGLSDRDAQSAFHDLRRQHADAPRPYPSDVQRWARQRLADLDTEDTPGDGREARARTQLRDRLLAVEANPTVYNGPTWQAIQRLNDRVGAPSTVLATTPHVGGARNCPDCGEFMGNSHVCPPTGLTDADLTDADLASLLDQLDAPTPVAWPPDTDGVPVAATDTIQWRAVNDSRLDQLGVDERTGTVYAAGNDGTVIAHPDVDAGIADEILHGNDPIAMYQHRVLPAGDAHPVIDVDTPAATVGPPASQLANVPVIDDPDVLPEIPRTPIASTAIQSIGYDVDDHRLDVQFSNDRVYTYADVPPHVVNDLLAADSVGRHFNERIRHTYDHVHAAHLDTTTGDATNCPACGQFTSPRFPHLCPGRATEDATRHPRAAMDSEHASVVGPSTDHIESLLNNPTADTVLLGEVAINDGVTVVRGTASLTRTNDSWTVDTSNLTGDPAAVNRAEEALRTLYTDGPADRSHERLQELSAARADVNGQLERQLSSTRRAQRQLLIRDVMARRSSVSLVDDRDAFMDMYRHARQVLADNDGRLPMRTAGQMAGINGAHRDWGVEIEFTDGDSSRIGERLYEAGLTNSPAQMGYGHGYGYNNDWDQELWRYETDPTVAGWGGGGEIVTPIVHSGLTDQTWQQIETVTDIVSSEGGQTRSGPQDAGGLHITVSTADLRGVGYYQRLAAGYHAYKDTLLRIGSDPLAGHRGLGYCQPNSTPNASAFRSMNDVAQSPKYAGINFGKVNGDYDDCIEYRFCDASLDPGTIQARVGVMRAFTDRALSTDWRPDTEEQIGSHRRRFGRRRLRGEEWDASTASIRSLADTLFHRDDDKQMLVTLWTAARAWQRPRNHY